MADLTRTRRRQVDPTPADLAVATRLAPMLEPWFARAGRDFPWRHWRDEYRLTVTEILLQRTRADAVAGMVEDFFACFPSWSSLGSADVADIAARLAPLGLQNRRAAGLVDLARRRIADPGSPPEDLPGVGQYVGRAVAVARSGARLPMVDANFVRMLDRVFGGPWMSDYRYDRRLQALASVIIERAVDVRAVNWAVLDLGATVCRPRTPRCELCPVATECRSAATATRGP